MTEKYEGDERRRQAWHLDKKVPIALFATLFIQTCAIVWWASEINSATREQAKAHLETVRRISEIESREREGNKLVERVVRVETIMENVLHTVNKIDDALTERKRK